MFGIRTYPVYQNQGETTLLRLQMGIPQAENHHLQVLLPGGRIEKFAAQDEELRSHLMQTTKDYTRKLLLECAGAID